MCHFKKIKNFDQITGLGAEGDAIPGASRLRNQNEILIGYSRKKNSLNGYF